LWIGGVKHNITQYTDEEVGDNTYKVLFCQRPKGGALVSNTGSQLVAGFYDEEKGQNAGNAKKAVISVTAPGGETGPLLDDKKDSRATGRAVDSRASIAPTTKTKNIRTGKKSDESDPSTSAESPAQGEKEKEEEIQPRLKICIDLTWLKKPLSKMTSVERKLFDVLQALKECCDDRFLCVRGLFALVDIGVGQEGAHKGGRVDAPMMLQVFEKLNIMHCLSESDIEACIYKLDPNCEGGCVETSELEKAVNKLTEMQVKNQNFGHGEQARRFDDEDVWFHRPNDPTDGVTVFGWVAFMESLMRLALGRLHKSGVGIQVSSPGGVKVLWMITFLRYNFDKLLQDNAQRCAWFDEIKQAMEEHKNKPRREAVLDKAWQGHSAKDPSGPGHCPIAIYQSYDLRMLTEKPDIFENWDAMKVGDIFQQTSVDQETRAGEQCSTCGRLRNHRGTGSIFCHICSGVDDKKLEQSILYPVLQRRRLHLTMKDKRSLTTIGLPIY